MNPFAELRLEDVLVGHGLADLPASDLQTAIARAADGRPLDGLLSSAEIERHFGVTELPGVAPRIVVLVCGVRAGKSFTAACAAIRSALAADLSALKGYERPRVAIVGPGTDSAAATFSILCGILRASAVLSALVVEETADTLVLKRPDGYEIEICVVAASRGGATVRNRWLAGLVLEEVAQFGVEATGAAVNAEQILQAAVTRLLPDPKCQAWIISSPFGPVGLLFDLYKRNFGKPGRVLVAHASTRALNPSFPEAQIEAVRAENPDVAAREYDAEWVDADESFFGASLIDPATRPGPLIARGRNLWCASGIDAGTRGNAWTLAIATGDRLEGGELRVTVLGVWQWVGSKQGPLSPKVVLKEIARLTRDYGGDAQRLGADGWSFDAIRDIAGDCGLTLFEHPSKDAVARYSRVKTLLGNARLELPPDPQLRTDLLGVRRRASSGGFSIHLPRTSDGRHCDYAPALALAVDRVVCGFELAALRPRIDYEFVGRVLMGAASCE